MAIRLLYCLCLLVATPLCSQEAFLTQSGQIRFNASTPLEDIVAKNTEVNAIYKPGSGELGLVLLMEDFRFPRALMEEHFNENYAESARVPKAHFRGLLVPVPDQGQVRGGTLVSYRGQAQGLLTMHGVSRQVSARIEMRQRDGSLRLESVFTVRPADYGIEVPELLFKKIAEEVRVDVSLLLLPEYP